MKIFKKFSLIQILFLFSLIVILTMYFSWETPKEYDKEFSDREILLKWKENCENIIRVTDMKNFNQKLQVINRIIFLYNVDSIYVSQNVTVVKAKENYKYFLFIIYDKEPTIDFRTGDFVFRNL